MFVELNFKSGIPAYLQIVEQIKYATASGALHPGEALPSIRILAEQLRINRNTVAKAYAELEHQGIVKIVQGKGVYISEKATPFNESLQNDVMNEAIDNVIVQAHHFQIDKKDLIDRFRKRVEQFEKKPKP
jgi:DNA-binding transcriptional regulator YhcF (GntR family)